MRDIDNDRAYPLPREGVLGGGSSVQISACADCAEGISTLPLWRARGFC